MNHRFANFLTVPLAALLLAGVPIAAITFASCSGSSNPSTAEVWERGRYLVEQVGLCADCHTPRDEQGRFRLDRWLLGSQVPFQPTVPMPWADVAPPLAGLPGLDDNAARQFLTTGELPGGRRPRPPMPEFRFAPEDAAAVIAYLRRPQPPALAAAH
jgi:hypothetical protein